MFKNDNHYFILTWHTNVLQENRNAQKSIKIIYLNMPSWADVLDYNSLRELIKLLKRWFVRWLLLWAHTEAQILQVKVETTTSWPTDICLFIPVNTLTQSPARAHPHIKSLLCKIFQSWGLKRQHISQLSVVHSFPVFLEPSPVRSLCAHGR